MKKIMIQSITLITCLLLSNFSIAGNGRPNVVILATGGTIAGTSQSTTAASYTAGKVNVEALITAVPQIKNIVNIRGEQIVNIGSQDMSDTVWLKLAKRVNQLLGDDEVDGVVITHGTDTMEESAYFLDLVTNSNKPVVFVGAMRPSNSLGADGPRNLYNAVLTAIDDDSVGRGVLVAMNDQVFDARNVTKTSTTNVEAFQSPNSGPIGQVYNGDVTYSAQTDHIEKDLFFDISNIKELPKVGIIYNYANASDLPVKALVSAKYDGIVSAGVGNGNLYHTVFSELVKARQQGIAVVRSSRVVSGSTTLDAEIDDEKFGFVASGTLNPQKARILLMLSLTQTEDYREIQQHFRY